MKTAKRRPSAKPLLAALACCALVTGLARASPQQLPQIRDPAGLPGLKSLPERHETEARPVPSLTETLCCGRVSAGNRIWAVDYPAGWQALLLPNNPNEFYGVILVDPTSSIRMIYVPAATTVPGAHNDTEDVDRFLDGVALERQQEFPGFEEFQRQLLPGYSAGRLWGGTWPGRVEQVWENLIVHVAPTNLAELVPGMPRGYLTMMGVRASSSEWALGAAIYEAVIASTSVQMLEGGGSPYGEGGPLLEPEATEPAVKSGMVRHCPRHCDWIWVDADSPNWACPRDGVATEAWETLCVE